MTASIVRGCGTRLAGGLYIVSDRSLNGLPLERFIVDPPQVINPQEMGLSPIGSVLIQRQGVTHILDWIGSENYYNVTDFLEETRRYGVSRRISRNVDFSRLNPESRLLLVHSRAQIDNAGEYLATRADDEFWCVRDIPSHVSNAFRSMCASLWWEDVEGGALVSDGDAPDGIMCGTLDGDMTGCHMHRRRREERAVVRVMPSFTYRAFARPPTVIPRYQPAIFASFPIHRIEVIYDRIGSTHVEGMERASRSRLPVDLLEE